MSAIVTRGLAKAYRTGLRRRRHRALADVDLEVPRGTAFGLIGLNGAGKTTFIKPLLGVVRPDAGEVTVLGGDPEDPAIRRRIGYLPERLLLRDAYTPRVFLRTVAAYKALPGARRPGGGPPARTAALSDCRRRPPGRRVLQGYAPAPRRRRRPPRCPGPVGPRRAHRRRRPPRPHRHPGHPPGRARPRRDDFLNSHLLRDRADLRPGGHPERRPGGHRDYPGGPGRGRRVAGAVRRRRGRRGPRGRGFERGEAAAPAGWRFPVDYSEALNAALDRARAAGARLVELAPDVPDLETLLARAVHP